MRPEIIVALITGAASIAGSLIALIGVIGSNKNTAKKNENEIKLAQAVTNEKITELTREVREHNGFARRMPVIEEQIKVINRRLNDLEKKEEKS